MRELAARCLPAGPPGSRYRACENSKIFVFLYIPSRRSLCSFVLKIRAPAARLPRLRLRLSGLQPPTRGAPVAARHLALNRLPTMLVATQRRHRFANQIAQNRMRQ